MWFADTISMLGSNVSGFAMPIIAVTTLGATTRQMGLIQALHSLPVLLFGLLAGVWVDRLNVQRLLITLDLVAAALIAIVPIAYGLGLLTLPMLYGLELAWGFLSPFWWPAFNRFLPQVVGNDLLVDANSMISVSISATNALGPLAAGALVQIIAAPVIVLADSVSFVVSAALYRDIRPRERPPAEHAQQTTFAGIREGLRLVFSDQLQRSLTIPRGILDVIDAMSLAIYVIFALRLVGLSPGTLGIVFALVSLGFLGGSLVAPKVERRLGAGPTAVLGLGMVGISPYTMLLADRGHPTWMNVAFLVVPGIVGGSGGILQYIAMNSIRQSITPDAMLGRVFATTGTLRALLSIVGALIGGYLGTRIGLRPTIAVTCVGYGIPFLYSLVAPFRSVRIRPEAEPAVPVEDPTLPALTPPLGPPPEQTPP